MLAVDIIWGSGSGGEVSVKYMWAINAFGSSQFTAAYKALDCRCFLVGEVKLARHSVDMYLVYSDVRSVMSCVMGKLLRSISSLTVSS